ncbi:MAG: hypothetical protein JXR77_13935 [Lentisphaeria bacterium]|nr:hypothetical protein [Lentisphaeria bacterium]
MAAPAGLITLRSMAIACALMPLLAMWVVQAELIWYTGHSTAISLFFHVTFVVFLLSLANLVLKRYVPRVALTPTEILTVYVMLSIAGALCSHDLLQIMIPMLTYPTYNANPQNRWDTLILPLLPSWAMVTDKEAIRGLAVGNAWLYRAGILAAWARPLAFWTLFLLALMTALYCINVFFRQPWTEQERLSFPIIQIPLMLASDLGALLRSRLFWIGFVITAAIDTLNGYHYLYPNIPEIKIVKAFEFREYFLERPWNAIASTDINLYPFVIGLVYFLPTDLAFSCWFFFVLFKLQLVLTSALGIHELPGFPFPSEQAAGGYLALGLLALWLARRHLRAVWRRILRRPGGADESAEPMSYRTALGVLLLSTTVLVGGGCALGGSPGTMAVFFVLFFLYSLAIARMRAELGPPAHDLHFIGPETLINNAVGTENVSGGNLCAFSMFFWFNRAYRAHFSAHSMEGMKIAQQRRVTARSMMVATGTALVVGLGSAYWALLHALYVHGYSGRPAGQAFAQQGWDRMAAWLSFPQEPRVAATVATAAGALFTLGLGLMRMRFTWWLWHPVGYATSTSWSMGKLWACIFIGWVAKALITRYGGAVAYRKAMPFFVGLVLGEFTVGSIWGIWGAVTSTPVYHFWG